MKVFSEQKEKYMKLFKENLSKSEYANILTWIEALESGSYEQGRSKLAQPSDEGTLYCCLGVANEVCDLGETHEYTLDSTIGLMGLRRPNGIFETEDIEGEASLVILNDYLGWNFKEIANLLRDQLPFSTVEGESVKHFVHGIPIYEVPEGETK